MEKTVIEIELKSICPVLFDRFTELPQPTTREGWKEQSIEKLYLNEDKEICIPANWIKAAMREASSELGKRTMAKKNRQLVRACVFFEPFLFSLGIKEPDIIHEEPVKRGQGSKLTTVVTFRPLIYEWSYKGIITLFGVSEDFARNALQLAGFKYGIGSYRPEYGRFILEKFDLS